MIEMEEKNKECRIPTYTKTSKVHDWAEKQTKKYGNGCAGHSAKTKSNNITSTAWEKF